MKETDSGQEKFQAGVLAATLARYWQTGDFQPCLRALGVDRGRKPMLALQEGLKRATDRRTRDTLEDIALHVSNGDSGPVPLAATGAVLLADAEARWGPEVKRFTAADQLEELAAGLWRTIQPPPSRDCLLAIIAMKLESAVSSTMNVSPPHYGKELGVFGVRCEKCGGQDGGQGQVICPVCFERARDELKARVDRGEVTYTGDGPFDLERAAVGYLRERARQFGCPACGRQPVRLCDCAKEFTVPARPRDGEIVTGRYKRSGVPCHFYLRLNR